MQSLGTSPACPVVASGSAAALDFHSQLGLQLTAVLDRLRTAQKMRVPSSGESSLQAVDSQTLAQAGKVSNSTVDTGAGAHTTRRYSRSQHEEEESDDIFDPNRLLNRFSSSVALYSRHRAPNLYEKSPQTASSLAAAASSSSCGEEWSALGQGSSLTKCLSTSDIPKMTRPGIVNTTETSVDLTTSTSSSESNTSLVKHYLGRRGSTGAVLSKVSPKALESLTAIGAESGSNAVVPAQPSPRDLPERPSSSDKSSKGFGLLSRTRQFGAWLTKTTEGEKVEVSRTDLNVVAPTSF